MTDLFLLHLATHAMQAFVVSALRHRALPEADCRANPALGARARAEPEAVAHIRVAVELVRGALPARAIHAPPSRTAGRSHPARRRPRRSAAHRRRPPNDRCRPSPRPQAGAVRCRRSGRPRASRWPPPSARLRNCPIANSAPCPSCRYFWLFVWSRAAFRPCASLAGSSAAQKCM